MCVHRIGVLIYIFYIVYMAYPDAFRTFRERWNASFVTSSVQFGHSVMSDSLQPYGLQLARPITNSRNLIKLMSIESVMPSNHLILCHPLLLLPSFSSCLQSFPASGSFPVSLFFTSAGQSIGASALASILPMNTQDWFPLRLTILISLQFKGLSRVFFKSLMLLQKHQFFSA